MVKFIFTKNSKKKLFNLEKDLQDRIFFKLKSLNNHPDIFSVLVQMKDCQNSTHRLRIGNFRIVMFLKNQKEENFEFVIVDIGHRREIYR